MVGISNAQMPMYQRSKSQYLYVRRADSDIPIEISSRESLNFATRSGISPTACLPSPSLVCDIPNNDVESQDGDECGLKESNHPDIPVYLRLSWELRINARQEPSKKRRRNIEEGHTVD